MTKYECKICGEIVVYRSLHFETCHADKIDAAFTKAPKGSKVTGGNPDEVK
jgi:hypothetical protein